MHVEEPHVSNVDEQIARTLQRFSAYTASCRERLVAGLDGIPCSAQLRSYLSRGKMVRAILVYLGAAAVGGNPEEVTVGAEAAELCHGASLIHDDIIDEAEQRRNLPALHVQVGEHVALVLGDLLLIRAFTVLGLAVTTLPFERVAAGVAILGQYGQWCCCGQVEELAPPTGMEGEDWYFSVVRGKTAALFAAAVSLGAVLAGGTEAQVEALRAYGLNLGIAFQMRDDLLDLTADSESLGKPAGNSLAQGRPLLPLILLGKKYGNAARFGCLTRQELVRRLEQEGILEQVRMIQQQHVEKALRALDTLEPSSDVDTLRTFAYYAGT